MKQHDQGEAAPSRELSLTPHKHNTGLLAKKIDELIEKVMQSGWGTVIIRIENYRIKELQDQATHRI